jgi:hypothetical protein
MQHTLEQDYQEQFRYWVYITTVHTVNKQRVKEMLLALKPQENNVNKQWLAFLK